MTFVLGKRSLENLDSVHPWLLAVIKRAIEISDVDFTVAEGLRSVKRQVELLNSGKSKTMNSKHLRQPDGFCHAVDIYPYVNGAVLYDAIDKDPFRRVASAMMRTASELSVALRWGNDWDGDGIEVGPDPDESFDDWPHYELRRV